jgi:transmembrane sensor
VANVVEFGARTSIEHQAREWLIRMDGDEPLSVSDREALREWMSRGAAHREELIRISKFWNSANVLAELVVFQESATQKRTSRRLRWVATAAVAASAVFASVILVRWNLQRLDQEVNGIYGTVIGEQKSISLSDGSSVQLNTDSEIQINYSGNSRKIRLLRGEALFSVRPDPNRAFEVYAADSVVRAVGTAFAVHLEGSKVDVTVTKGVVAVADAGSVQAPLSRKIVGAAPVQATPSPRSLGRVKAGEMASFGSGVDHIDVHRLAEPELQRRMAWHEGYLAFSGEPLSEVIEQVNRYSPVTVQIGDPKLASIAIGGRFRVGDLDAILDALQTNFGIQSHRVNDQNIRLESEHDLISH